MREIRRKRGGRREGVGWETEKRERYADRQMYREIQRKQQKESYEDQGVGNNYVFH